MSGLFAVNKPSGISSAGLLNDLQHILKKSPLFEPEIRAQTARTNAGRKGRKQKMGNKIKMGHGGTLDPLASGVLVVGTGRGTKDLGKFLSCSKDYEAIALFGCSTDTYDSEGKIVHRRPWKHITREVLEEALPQFRGDIMQTPPIYSALKMQGKPLYEYAREGKPLPAEIKARPATVSHFEITDYTTDHNWNFPTEDAPTEIVLSAEVLEQLPRSTRQGQQPAVSSVPKTPVSVSAEAATSFQISPSASHNGGQGDSVQEDVDSSNDAHRPTKRSRTTASDVADLGVKSPILGQSLAVHIKMTVSSGTYVRSLIHDLGLALGSAAHMVALVRKRVGEFTLEEAVPWADFEADRWQEALKKRIDFAEVSTVNTGASELEQNVIEAEHLRRLSLLPPAEQKVAMFLRPCMPFRHTLTYAQSLDGRIAGPHSKPLIISCPESFRITHELRRAHDLILIGVGTARNDDPGLNARDQEGTPYPLEEQPIPVILDPHGRFTLAKTSKMMSNFRRNHGRQPLQIVHERMRGHVHTDATLIYLGTETTSSLDPIRVIAEVLRQKAADQLIVTVAPTYVGDGVGLDIVQPVALTGVRTESFGRDAVIAGRLRQGTLR